MRRLLPPKTILLTILLTLLTHTGIADDQGWFTNSLTLRASPAISIKFTQEIRHNELTLADAYLSNLSGGITWTLNTHFYFGVSYLRETTLKSTENLYENRTTLEAGWKRPVSEKIGLDLRFRTEVRSFESDLTKDHLRLRLRARLMMTLTLGGFTCRPFLAVEPFANITEGYITSNRVYSGVSCPLTKQLEWTINYIRQDTTGREALHIFNTGFDLKF